MSYTPTRIGNPCIHCSDTKGNCRTHKTGEMHLCVSLAGSKKGEKSQGYVAIGDTSDGRWLQLLPDNGTEYSSEKIRELRLEWQRQEEQAKRDRIIGEMPATERDRHYRDILAQLSLCSDDKADLVRRGFTNDQIVKSNFKSVERWQKLSKTYPGNLPGINSRGDGLITHTPGYLCPIPDDNGLIVGLQVRKRILTEGDTQRYYFLSQDSSIRLNDQIPLAVFSPCECLDKRIGLVEGVGAKPFLTCERLGIPVIGAAGGHWASSEKHLKQALLQLGVGEGDAVTIFADAGSVRNKSVIHQYKRTEYLLESWDYVVSFAWWCQVDKSFGDIDELKPEQCNEIRFLSTAEFKALCIKWGGLIPSGTGFSGVNKKQPSRNNRNNERFLCEVRTSEKLQINGETSPSQAGSIRVNGKGIQLESGTISLVENSNNQDIQNSRELHNTFSGQRGNTECSGCENSSNDREIQRSKSTAETIQVNTERATPNDYWERVAEAQRKLHTLSYPADLVCNPERKYLPNLVGRIPAKGIVLLNSPKGSGKSHQIKTIKQHCCGCYEEKITYPEAPEFSQEQQSLFAANKQPLPTPEPIIEKVWNPGLGMKFVSINARIALGREQAIRWEFTYIEDADTNAGKEEFGAELTKETVIENIGEIGLCVDSLAKLKHRDWSNTVIVIDEIELVLNHASTSSTCRDKRSEILQIIQDKIKEALDNGGLLIGADADITDVTVDYLKALVPNHPAFIVSHDFKGDPWEISFCAEKRDQILSQIVEHLADPECEPIAVAIDNQKEAEALDMVLKRKYPYLENQIGGLIRIDSRITQQDFGKDFVKKPNESINKYLPKILIYTPSLGVGCSIDVKYFKHVYGLFFGNLEPSQARQMLARVRESVPRTVWAKVRAGNAENEATSYLPKDIKKRMFGKNETAMVPLEMALAKAMAEVKASGIDDPEDKDVLPVLIETLQKMQGKDGSWNNPHLDLYCNQQARRNFALSQFAVQLRQELIDEGHDIIDIDGEEKTETGEMVKEGKEEIRQRDSTLTATAEDIPFKDAQELKRKAARTIEEEHKISKAFLKHDLPELELSADFIYKAVHKDNGRWLSQAKLFWLLHNPEALASKDEKHWKSKLSQFSKGVTCLWDVKADKPKVDAILNSGLFDWIKLDNFDVEYCSNSPGGEEFLRKCLANKKALRNALNITVNDNSSPIAIANKLLDRLGLKLAYSSRIEKIKYYKLDEELATDRDRKAVFDALNLKWKNEVAKMAEVQAPQATQQMTEPNNFLYKNNGRSGNYKPEELPQNHVVSHTTDEWLTDENLADTANLLEACDDAEMLEDIRTCFPARALKAASRLLPESKRTQIKQWVLGLNQVLGFDALVPIPGF